MATESAGPWLVPKRKQVVRPVSRTRERIFFGGMALLMIGTILLGFRQTYFSLGAKPPALSSWVILLHGTIFSTYLALFFVQVALISARRVQWHKTMGLAVYGLAAFMVPLGVLSAADEIRRDLANGPPFMFDIDPRTFSIVSVMGMVMFGSLITCSYFARFKPAVHKRFALFATLSMMDAGIDRWPMESMGISHAWALWIYTAYLLLPVAYDLISLRRVHWVTMIAAPYVWTLHRVEIPIGFTHAWQAVANLMLHYFHY